MSQESSIICPHCNNTLEKDFFERKINYICKNCGGRTLSLGALRGICANKKFPNMLWQMAKFGYSDEGIVCPCCKSRMRKVTLPLAGKGFELDICCECQTIWFDQNELEQIPIIQKEQNTLPPEAREAIAMHQIELESHRYDNSVEESFNEEDPWKLLPSLLGLPVETNIPPCKSIPFITLGISLLCIAIYAFVRYYYNLNDIISHWGFVTNLWSREYGLTMITSQFLHASWIHLLINIYFLFVFGDNVEEFLGRFKYILLIVLSGLTSLLMHALLDSRTGIPLVGASGFISGVIACYGILFPKARLTYRINYRASMLLYSYRHFLVTVPAWFALICWFVLQIVGAYFIKSRVGGTAYWGHIGGALMGAIFAAGYYYLQYRQFKKSDYEKNYSFD